MTSVNEVGARSTVRRRDVSIPLSRIVARTNRPSSSSPTTPMTSIGRWALRPRRATDTLRAGPPPQRASSRISATASSRGQWSIRLLRSTVQVPPQRMPDRFTTTRSRDRRRDLSPHPSVPPKRVNHQASAMPGLTLPQAPPVVRALGPGGAVVPTVVAVVACDR